MKISTDSEVSKVKINTNSEVSKVKINTDSEGSKSWGRDQCSQEEEIFQGGQMIGLGRHKYFLSTFDLI